MTELAGTSGALIISGIAMSIVFLILGAMALFMHFLGWSVDKSHRFMASRATKVAVESATDNAQAPTQDIDDETVAAITAAMSIVMENKRFRVASITPTNDDKSRWIMATRQAPPAAGQKGC